MIQFFTIVPEMGEFLKEFKEYISEKLLDCNSWCDYTIFSWMLLFFGILSFIIVLMNKSIQRLIMHHLKSIAFIVFVVGILLYILGFSHEGTAHNPFALCLRSVIASMEMFVSESELIEVSEEMKDNPCYMMIFSLTHFLAICVSAAFIIHVMGIRAISYLRMRLTFFNSPKDIYVFFDLSQEAITLAKDIYAKKDNKNSRIVFVRTPMEESHIERFSFSHILNFVDNKNETIGELNNISALLTYSRKSVVIGMNDQEWKDTIGLKALRRYINKSTGEKYFFCLSPNEENNINTAIALSQRYPKGKIYCRANHDSVTESFASLNLKFIDSANLSVMELKKNVSYQPVSFVKPDTKAGVATKPFRSMIIGFGETGFEVFRFLYEFGSFVGKDIEENPFFCDIIDPKAKELEDCLYLHCPAVEVKKESDDKNSKAEKNNTYTINFYEGTIESNRELIINKIKNLDYIVVCTDNEKENLSIGITLLNLAYKYRHYSDKLAIFIGINDNKEFEKAQKIADYYNECGKKDKKEHLYEFSIIPFGAKKQLFTCKNIIDEEIVNRAQEFYFEYVKTSNLLDVNGKYECAKDKESEWKHRRNDKTPTGKMGLFNKNELTLKESQDMANVWHIQTKLHLVGACTSNCSSDSAKCPAEIRREELFKCMDVVMHNLIIKIDKVRNGKDTLDDSHKYILDQIKSYEQECGIPDGEYQTLFENLAKCEHLRWSALTRMLGYRTFENAVGNEKHFLQKTHACLVSNGELVKDKDLNDTVKYDYNTILVSMRE